MGYAGQVTLGHDMNGKGAGHQNGNAGYVLWPQVLKEFLDSSAIAQEDYDKLTRKNPARILAITE